VKWEVAPAVVRLAADISPVVDTHPVVEVVPADNAVAVLQVFAVAAPVDIVVVVPADIDKVSSVKALLDFENFPARACPAGANLAELALWDRIDYDIDLAWSILFCIHAINKKMKQFDIRLYARYPVALANNKYLYIRTNESTVSCRSYFLVQSSISTFFL